MTATVRYILGFVYETSTLDGIGPDTTHADIALLLTDLTGVDIIPTDIQSVTYDN